jgi:hypothetical protein
MSFRAPWTILHPSPGLKTFVKVVAAPLDSKRSRLFGPAPPEQTRVLGEPGPSLERRE